KALGLPMILGVRDPVSRFKSFWSETQTARQWAEMRGWSPVRLLLFVKRHLHADPHWRPQFDYYVDGVEVVRFDRLLERVGLEPRHDHKSTVPHPEVPEDEINRVHADDVLLWRLANERAKRSGRRRPLQAFRHPADRVHRTQSPRLCRGERRQIRLPPRDEGRRRRPP